MEHDRKREIEVKCLELQDKLEEEEYNLNLNHDANSAIRLDPDQIEEKVAALREKLNAQNSVIQDVKRYPPASQACSTL